MQGRGYLRSDSGEWGNLHVVLGSEEGQSCRRRLPHLQACVGTVTARSTCRCLGAALPIAPRERSRSPVVTPLPKTQHKRPSV